MSKANNEIAHKHKGKSFVSGPNSCIHTGTDIFCGPCVWVTSEY